VQDKGIDAEMAEVVALIRSEMRRILSAHRLPINDAKDLVRQTLLEARASWRAIDGDRRQWLLTAIEFECLTYWQKRGLRSPAMPGHAPPPAREVPLTGRPGGASLDMDVLRAMLPAARRRVLLAKGGVLDRLRILLSVDGQCAGGMAQ
jgi:hypothetical protein